MANPTITINATGITVSGPLIAGEPVAVTASGISLPEGAALTLALSSRAPNALLASCVLAESEETPGTWTGTLETASRQMAVYFATAAADDTRPAVLELVETTTRDSLALLVTSIRNSALIPSSSPCAVAPVYIPVPGPPGDPQPSDADPLMDGAASAGSATTYARGDHKHPTCIHAQSAGPNGILSVSAPTRLSASAFAIEEIPTALGMDEALSAKQDAISDLAAIRSGAAAGATAVQQDNIAPQWSASATYPPDSCVFREGVLFFSVRQTGPGWNENDWIVPPNGVVQRINGSIDSLAAAVNQVSGALSNKQDIISDLAAIRSGAAAGATAVQPAALSAYRTAAAQDAIDGAQDTAIAAKANAASLADPFSDQRTYAVGDYVTYEGLLYKCTTAVSTAGAWDSTKWEAVAVTDEMGGGQVQADWSQTDSAAPDYIKNKPTIPPAITVDSTMSSSSTNPVQNKVVNTAIDGRVPWANAAKNAVTIGTRSGVVGDYSVAQGISVTATGARSHAEGDSTTATGGNAHAEGYSTSATGISSHAEGRETTAAGAIAHAEGLSTYAAGRPSHSEGEETTAAGIASHADGYRAVTAASGNGSGATTPHDYAFAWQGVSTGGYYRSHGAGTYNVNPVGGIGGFYVGEDSLASLLRYAFASPTPGVAGSDAMVVCEDRSINDFTVPSGVTRLGIGLPAAMTGRARDFFCRVTLTDSSLPTVTLPAGQTVDIGQSEINGMTQGVNLLMFTEIASGHWLASRRSAS